MRAAIGIDLGGTKLSGALVDETGKIRFQRTHPTEAHLGTDSVVASMAALARLMDEDGRAAGFTVVGVGVGAPGPLDPKTGVVFAMPNLGPGWKRYPLRGGLEKALGKKVHVENDANAAMQGEHWIGAAAGSSDAVMLTLGTGVGGGIVTAGLLIRGVRGAGGELGHIVVEDPTTVKCPCGGRGCLEQFASGTGVGRLAVAAVAGGGKGALALLGRAPTSHDVLDAAQAGDALALTVLERAGRALGVGLVSIVHSLNPEVIVIGGGFGAAAFDRVVPVADKELRSRALEASVEGLRIVPATLGNDAGVIGAARSVLLGA